MPRGQRQGQLTREHLLKRLASDPSRPLPPRDASSATLVGHAIHYGLLTADEIRESVPRVETTIACYLRTILPSDLHNAVETYAIVASRCYNRGTYLLNLVAMHLYGNRMPLATQSELLPILSDEFGRLGREEVRYDRATASDAADPFLRFIGEDVRNSPFKQAFLPERWPTASVHLHPTISSILRNEVHLPPEPTGWKFVMCATGWDNAINRMATKALGNFKVHSCCGLTKRTSAWLGCGRFFDEPLTQDTLHALQETLTKRPRPLAVHSDVYEMVLDLRSVLGVTETDKTWYPPDSPPYTSETAALHLFVTCYGPGERSYMPVARRSRKFSYVDHKVYSALKTALGKTSAEDPPARKRRAKAKGPKEEEDEMHKESISLGNSMGLTPSEFNEKRRDLRAVLQRRATERKRKHPNSPSARRLQKKRMRLGSGMMNRHAIIQSMETDGVGARLCVRTPIDIRPYVKAVEVVQPSEDLPSSSVSKGARSTRKRSRKEKSDERDREKEAAVLKARLESPPPITVGFDAGRKKLFVGAVCRDVIKKPETVTFTRARYYAEMGYWRHQTWSKARTSNSTVARALADVSVSGGYRNCDLDTWRSSLEAERRHEKVLDEEFVVSPDYALWKMRLHRKKRSSLDRNTGHVIRLATHGQSPERLLLLGMGDAKFSSSGKGEQSAPTSAVTEAFRRSMKKEMLRNPKRQILMENVSEFRTTLCCCACGSVTTKARVRSYSIDGGWENRESRRLRLCTRCEETGGKRRDRDVQGARNMLWILQHEYYGGRENRPWYMTRKGCCGNVASTCIRPMTSKAKRHAGAFSTSDRESAVKKG